MKLVFLDTETTNTDDSAEVVELAYSIASGSFRNVVISEKKRFKPKTPITIGAMCVHGITNQVVDALAEVSPADSVELNAAIGGAVIVGHNIGFDIRVLRNSGFEFPEKLHLIDTLNVAKHLVPAARKHSLPFLMYFLNLLAPDEVAQSHNASFDVDITHRLFLEFAERIQGANPSFDDREVLKELIRLSQEPATFQNFTFGKHSGKTVQQVMEEDPSYISWLFSSEIQKKELEQNKGLIATLSPYLNQVAQPAQPRREVAHF